MLLLLLCDALVLLCVLMRGERASFYRWRGGVSLKDASSPHAKHQTDLLWVVWREYSEGIPPTPEWPHLRSVVFIGLYMGPVKFHTIWSRFDMGFGLFLHLFGL